MSRTTKSPLAMARAALAAAKQVVPPYSCKHSRKDFTQPQLLALLLLKQFFKIGYRDVVAWVAEWSDLREALGLSKVPHFTAIQKAGARLLKNSWEAHLDATVALARRHAQDQKIFLRVLALNLMIVCWTLWRFLQSSRWTRKPGG